MQMSSHLPSPVRPTENTLTINVTHEMLEVIHEDFPETVAVSPTREAENDYGYDTAMDWAWAKAVAFQFKRPFEETGTIQNRNGTEGRVKFEADPEQLETLQNRYREREAFLTLPLVRDRREMPDNLGETVFVDVHGIEPSNPSRIYVKEDWRPECTSSSSRDFHHSDSGNWCVFSNLTSEFSFTIGNFRPGSLCDSYRPTVHVKYDSGVATVHPEYVYTWSQLWKGIQECKLGRVLRAANEEWLDGEKQLPKGSGNKTVIVLQTDSLPDGIDWHFKPRIQ